jgi:hypothetical protein
MTYARPFVCGLAVVLPFLLACGTTEQGEKGAGVGDDGGGDSSAEPGGRLREDAVKELEELGARAYEGKAVETGEEPQEGGVVRVTYDANSGPRCLRGGDYAAFYADRGSDRTLILLDGGGACWTGFCFATETAEDSVTTSALASDDPANHFHDWNLVYLPYCDGSVFSGDNELTEADGTTPRYHHGRQNLAAGLDLAKKHFGGSKQVLIGGFSAGGYGTLTGMIGVRLLFPDADLYVLDDSGPGLQNLDRPSDIDARLAEWKFDAVIPASCTTCDQGHGQLTQIFPWFLARDATAKVSLVSYFEDGIIGGTFLQLPGPDYKALLQSETAGIHEKYPDRFKRYMLPGSGHVVSGVWDVATADGVKLSDWVTAMVKGDAEVWRDIQATGP